MACVVMLSIDIYDFYKGEQHLVSLQLGGTQNKMVGK